MYDYTIIHQNADKILQHYIDNPQGRQRLQDSEFAQLVSGLTNIAQAFQLLYSDGYVTIDGHANNMYTITAPGTIFATNGGYEKDFERLRQKQIGKEKTDALGARKLEVDLANAERVYKTYFSTRAMAIIATIVSITLLLLKLAEVFGLLSEHKK